MLLVPATHQRSLLRERSLLRGGGSHKTQGPANMFHFGKSIWEMFGFEEEDGGFVQETPETFEEVVASPEAPKVEEPVVRKDPTESVDKSDDISGIIDKWSTKD